MLSDSPPERDLQWTDTGITSSFKFINKLFDLVEKFKNYSSVNNNNDEVMDSLKILINEVSENIESFQFNKSVAKIYEYVNIISNAISSKKLSKIEFEWSLKKLSIILQPLAPHISEEIWSSFNMGTLCINEMWIKEDVKQKNKLSIAIQINGKTKEVIEVNEKSSEKEVIEKVKNNEKIKKNINEKKILREIYVPGKIVNFVIK